MLEQTILISLNCAAKKKSIEIIDSTSQKVLVTNNFTIRFKKIRKTNLVIYIELCNIQQNQRVIAFI